MGTHWSCCPPEPQAAANFTNPCGASAPFDPTAKPHFKEMITVAEMIADRRWIPLLRQTTGITNDQVFLSESFLRGSEDRYRQWMHFLQAHTDQEHVVHPTFAMDVAWHAHMVDPVHYAMSCQVLVGHLLDHSPWPEATQQEKKNRIANSNSLWAEFTGEDMTVPWWNVSEISPGN